MQVLSTGEGAARTLSVGHTRGQEMLTLSTKSVSTVRSKNPVAGQSTRQGCHSTSETKRASTVRLYEKIFDARAWGMAMKFSSEYTEGRARIHFWSRGPSE